MRFAHVDAFLRRIKLHRYQVGSYGSVDGCMKAMVKHLAGTPIVETGHWQGTADAAQTRSVELRNTVIEMPISPTPGSWASFVEPNIPWADEHFEERVSGVPHNPPPSHVNWPYAQADNEEFVEGGRFSHTYPERLWPGTAGVADPIRDKDQSVARIGIHYPYGDLNDAVSLLLQFPTTRQCFIPIWFPEDLHAAAMMHARVPCTLGYHLMMRQGELHCFYPMRSLDLLRYFQDDAYMAGRLVQWVLDKCRERAERSSANKGYSSWDDIQPGQLTIFAASLHIFEGDIPIVKHRWKI